MKIPKVGQGAFTQEVGEQLVGTVAVTDASPCVKSVRQRVANLIQYAAFDSLKTIEGVNVHLINTLCARTRTLTREEIAAIDEIEKDYLNPQFIAGK